MPSTRLTRRRLLAGVSSILLGGCVSTARTPELTGHDWPMPGRDPGRTGYAPAATPPRTEPDVAWNATPDPASGLSPIVANGTLYYQTSDTLFVLDPKTGAGKRVGTYSSFEGTAAPAFAPSQAYRDGMYIVPYGNEIVSYPAAPNTWPESIAQNGRQRMRWSSVGESLAVGSHPAGRYTRAVARPIPVGGAVVFRSGGPNGNRVTVLDVDDGSVVWNRRVGRSFDVTDPPRLRVSTTVVDTDDEKIVSSYRAGPRFPGGLEARDMRDGSHRWSRQLGDSHDAIAASDGTVFVSVSEPSRERATLVAVATDDGHTRWKRPLSVVERYGLAVDDTHCYHLGSSASDGDGPLRVTAVAREDGTRAWSREVGVASSYGLGTATQHPTVGGSVVFAPGGEMIHAFNAQTGERLWQFGRTVETSGGSQTPRRPMTPVLPVGERLLAVMTLALYGLEGA